MRIALTGVSGFIGSRIAVLLHDAGHQVTGLVRSTSRRDHIEHVVDRFVVGDQANESIRPDLLDGADCLVHNGFDWQSLKDDHLHTHLDRNLSASLKLIDAAHPRHVVFMSSVAVFHDMRPRWQGRPDEDHPLRPAGLYGACKAAIEDHLWAMHFSRDLPISILRPCAVYGIDPKLERSIGYPIIKRLIDERRCGRAGGGKFVHVDDVAQATLATVENESANGGVYNLADCYARWADWAQWAAEVLGIDAEIDLSSPPQPKNTFTKDAARALGVPLDRGSDGIRNYLRELIDVMDVKVRA